MKFRLFFSVISTLSLCISAFAGSSDVPRILLVGDSWPGFMQVFRCFDATMKDYPDLSGIGQRGDLTTLVGVRASEFDTPEFMDVVIDELNTYPTIDIVHLTLGGNDVVGDSGWTPDTPVETIQTFIDSVNERVESVIDQILAVRPNIRVALCSYDCGNHLMAGATPAQMNGLWLQMEQSHLAMARRKDRVFFVNNLGLMQYHYGIPQADPPIPPYFVPYPGGYPDYDPMPGGDLNYNSPLEALIDNDLHLTMQGYDILAKRCIDEFYHSWLTWPAVIEILALEKGRKEPLQSFQITFSEPVTGIDESDFAVEGVSGATVDSVSGADAFYTVTVNLNGGSGSVALRVLDDDSIIDSDSNPLGGPGENNGGFSYNGEIRYADAALNGNDDFDGVMNSLNSTFTPVAWLLSDQSFDPEDCDVNGGTIELSPPSIVGNGMLDACELGLIYTALHDDSLDLSATGGITHAMALEAWQHNIDRMQTDLGGTSGRICMAMRGVDTLLAGLMTLGDSGSITLPTLLITGIRSFVKLPSDVITPSASNYILLAEYLGPDGDADGDGFTNRQEYDYFFPLNGREGYIAAALHPSTVPAITEGEGVAEGEGDLDGEGGSEGQTEGEEPALLDFCKTMDAIYTVTQSEAMASIVDMMGDYAALLSMIQCSVADLNGPFVDTSEPPDGTVDQPGPNGLLDGAYELGVIAELVNFGANHAGLSSGTLPGQSAAGVDPTAAAAAYQANYDALYAPLEPFIPILPNLVQSLAHITLTSEQTKQIQELLPDLISVLAGYATLGDEDSLGMVLFLTNLLDGFLSGMPTDAADFETLSGILGPDGDADGDGFTNRQEYSAFSEISKTVLEPGPEAYVNAVLDPGINPDRPNGLLDFCKTMDAIYTVTQSEAMASIVDMMGDYAALLSMIQCSVADLNGPFVDTSVPPDGTVDQPGPNGLLDGAYELGVIAELVNFGANYAGLSSGTLPGQGAPGVDPVAATAAYQANYDALYAPLEPFIPVLPNLVQSLAHITLTSEQTKQIQELLPDLISVLAGYATLGDEDSLGMVLFLTNLLGGFLSGMPTDAADFETLNGILGPGGDADGDGFTNYQEYDHFSALKGANEYVHAALNPSITPNDTGEGEGPSEEAVHSADEDGNGRISLSELLRTIQFFNSGGFHCQSGTEDGYAPGAGDQSCAAYDSDYSPQDWVISLTELLRLIQFFSSGAYHACPSQNTEDGFCPGA